MQRLKTMITNDHFVAAPLTLSCSRALHLDFFCLLFSDECLNDMYTSRFLHLFLSKYKVNSPAERLCEESNISGSRRSINSLFYSSVIVSL
jgi:hypothetical protein